MTLRTATRRHRKPWPLARLGIIAGSVVATLLVGAAVLIGGTQVGHGADSEGDLPPWPVPPTGLQHPDVVLARPPSEPEEAPPVGIIDVSSPLSSLRFDIQETGWQDYVGADFVNVYTGAFVSNPAQGVVVVESGPPDVETAPDFDSEVVGPGVTVTEYPTPTQAGSVVITASSGFVLTLAASGNTQFYFNVQTRQYVQSP